MFLLGRILYGGTLALMGTNHFMRFSTMVEFAASKGIPFPAVSIAVSGLVLVGGGLMVATGFRPKLGATALVLFLLAAAVLVHNFWMIEDPAMARQQMTHFLKNLALAGGGLMVLYIPGPWSMSVGSGQTTEATPARREHAGARDTADV